MLYNAYDFVPKIALSISALDSEPVTETGSRVVSSCNLVARAEENPGNGVVPVVYQRPCVGKTSSPRKKASLLTRTKRTSYNN